MYMPRAFTEENRATILDHIRQYPFATLIVSTPDNHEMPFLVDHLPLLLHKRDDGNDSLFGHIAINNPLVEVLQTMQETQQIVRATAVFHGEHQYISPRWYASKMRGKEAVPTWNYSVVDAHGTLCLGNDMEVFKQELSDLSQHFEEQVEHGSPWRMSDASPRFIDGMTRGIHPITFHIDTFSSKRKASQNRSSEDRDSVRAGLKQAGISQQIIEQVVIDPIEKEKS